MESYLDLAQLPAEAGSQRKKITAATAVQAIGVGSTAIGALVLMVEGLGRVDAIERFFSFSGILALCAALGLVVSYRDRSPITARLLLGMFLSLVPVFWSQLGAVMFSAVGGSAAFVPAAFRVEGVSVVGAIAGLVFAGAIVVPLSALVARVLTPHIAGRYAALLAVGGLAFCVPERSGPVAGLVLCVTAGLVVAAERLLFSSDTRLQTKEALWSRGILISVPAILVGRAAFYTQSGSLVFALSLTLGAMLCWLAPILGNGQQKLAAILSDFLTAVGLFALVGSSHVIDDSALMHLLSYGLPAAYLALAAWGKVDSPQTIGSAALLAIGGTVFKDDPAMIASIASVLLPMAAVVLAVISRSRLLLAVGLITSVISYLTFVANLWETLYPHRWMVLMLVGITLIFSASRLERLTVQLKNRWIVR